MSSKATSIQYIGIPFIPFVVFLSYRLKVLKKKKKTTTKILNFLKLKIYIEIHTWNIDNLRDKTILDKCFTCTINLIS